MEKRRIEVEDEHFLLLADESDDSSMEGDDDNTFANDSRGASHADGGRSVGTKELRMADDDDSSLDDAHEAVQPRHHDHDDEDDDDDENVMAAVVVDDDDDDVNDFEQVQVAVEADQQDAPRTVHKKKKKKSKHHRDERKVSSERLEAASDARAMLIQTVPRLPVVVSDSHVIRSLGRLCLESSTQESRFSSANALYPIGFSCDRYEFSPVHGRVLKMRCTIFDGRKIKEKQKHKDTTLPDGPVFRVMWGEGVDYDNDIIDYPYNPKSASTYISSSKVDTPPPPITSEDTSMDPEEGMRVKVRYEHDEWFTGTIIEVGDEELDKKRNRVIYDVRIQYDDGSIEDTTFPDEDISIHLPGSEDEANRKGLINLTQLRGKPVTSVIGNSPLEAWGKALVALGLIDEIMFKSAFDSLSSARIEGRAEAEEKIEALKLQRQQARARMQQRQAEAANDDSDSADNDDASKRDHNDDGSLSSSSTHPGGEDEADGVKLKTETEEKPNPVKRENGKKEDLEPPSEKEEELRTKVEALREELATLQAENREAAIDLADARISTMGPFLCNPFRENDPANSQQSSWLATVVRKEKSRMGSTGNKKKVVTATDLMERNDTFFNGDIEALVEGLPGSEFCHSYVFQVLRAGGAAAVSQAWVHEAKIRQEREREKQRRSVSEAKAKASQLKEKEMKRKRRDEVRDARKKQKLEEVEQKKRARAEERLSRLGVQVDERLLKEAAFQREKVILLMAKSLSKEFARRRKAAELVAGQVVVNESLKWNNKQDFLPKFDLPPLSRLYDEDVLRVWDFISSFGNSFLQWGYLDKLPTLDSLQNAIDALRDDSNTTASRTEAVDSLVKLAVVLCQPLGASLTKLLFASLIALNPALQKDFGAAFFAEVNASANSKDESGGAALTALLPVNSMTWQEVARLAFLSDALGEFGLSRQECAHLLRGYRSGGHPNSKEAKRLRRAEEFSISVLRQEISQTALQDSFGSNTIGEHENEVKLRVRVPCEPSSSPSSWTFYLHNVKSLQPNAATPIKNNIIKAVTLLKSTDPIPHDAEAILGDLEKSLALLGKIGTTEQLSSSETNICNKARLIVLKALSRATGETYDSEAIGHVVSRDSAVVSKDALNLGDGDKLAVHKLTRQRIGLLNSLALTDQEYKHLVHEREEYMSDALRLKEEMEFKEHRGEDDDDEEEEDDDEEELEDDTNATESATPSKLEKEHDDDHHDDTVTSLSMNGTAQEEKKTGDDTVATEIVATVVDHGEENVIVEATTAPGKIGKATPYDEFCEDVPAAPELIRRCLAVLRTLCLSGPAEPFIYPVDPQTTPGYYESVLRPMCLREVGRQLQVAAKLYAQDETSGQKESIENEDSDAKVEAVVAQFARNIRLIYQNCSCYTNAGPAIISSGEELIRIFERILLDWVLAPEPLLPPLEHLDDDRCVEHHSSDEDSLVLLCDGCEGKYNMSRLEPPLHEVPKGDWYCPRCLSGRCWEDLDPRIGKRVKTSARSCRDISDSIAGSGMPMGTVSRCLLGYPEGQGTRATLVYTVEYEGRSEAIWSLEELDKALAEAGDFMPAIRCLEAVAESPGYGRGADRGLYGDLIPASLNPSISDTAAQAALSSSMFCDTIASSSALLLISPEEMTASEWLRLLVLLIMKCSSSEIMQSVASKAENEAAEKMAKRQMESGVIREVAEVLPNVTDDEGDGADTKMDVGLAPDLSRQVSSTGNVDTEVQSSELPRGDVIESAAVVVEASEIEVVADVNAELVTSTDAQKALLDQPLSNGAVLKSKRATALAEKEKRQREREDSIAALCIKHQLRPTVASFEEDRVSQVVDSTLSTNEDGLGITACRSRGMVCDFCGLSDNALGTPLVRVPNKQEWNELMPHAARFRRVYLLADISCGTNGANGGLPGEGSQSTKVTPRNLRAVSIRVNGELISRKEEDFIGVSDGGMMEFLPRNELGFQDDLRFRHDVGLPFVTGSLSAHESCAIAAHNTRKERMVQDHQEKQSMLLERVAGMKCGRTLSLGKDALGRSYWRFQGDHSLFVCINSSGPKSDQGWSKTWHRFAEPEDIASVMFSLGKDSIVVELKRAFPSSARMLPNRKWAELLLKRRYPLINVKSETGSLPLLNHNSSSCHGSVETKEGAKDPSELSEDEDEPYQEGESVLVESRCKKLLWDATVIGVARSPKDEKVVGYRVHYNDWSSRFDEWVEPFRVVEPSSNNIEVQEELLEEYTSLKDEIPPSLQKMAAKDFLVAKDRVRSSPVLPNFSDVAKCGPSASSDDVIFGLLKAALLMIDASLPLGVVDNSESGPWSPAHASQWRKLVKSASGPSSLMRCTILLEDCISPEWMEPQFSHLLACMPIRWKAINEASVSSLALRILLLDQGMKYATVDKQKYAPSSRGGRK